MAETADRVVIEILADVDAADAKIETHRRKFEQAMASDSAAATKMEATLTRSATGAGTALARIEDGSSRAAIGAGRLGSAIKSIAPSGRSALIVLAQEASSLEGALVGASAEGAAFGSLLGPIGTAAGAAAGILAAYLIPKIFGTGEAAEDATAKVKGLTSAIKSMADLGPRVQNLLTKQGDLARIEGSIANLRSRGGRGPALQAAVLARDAAALKQEITTEQNFITVYAQRVASAADATAGSGGANGKKSLRQSIKEVGEAADLAFPSVSAIVAELAKIDVTSPEKAAADAASKLYSGLGIDPSGDLDAIVKGIDDRKDAEFKANELIADDFHDKQKEQIKSVADFYEQAMLGGTGNIVDTLKRGLIHAIAQALAQQTVGGGGNFFSNVATSLGSAFGFASGGSFTIGGRGGTDRNVMSLNGRPIANVSRGERVSISPTGRASSGASGGTIVQQTIVLDARYGITTPELLAHVNAVASAKARQAGEAAFQASTAAVPGRVARQQTLGT